MVLSEKVCKFLGQYLQFFESSHKDRDDFRRCLIHLSKLCFQKKFYLGLISDNQIGKQRFFFFKKFASLPPQYDDFGLLTASLGSGRILYVGQSKATDALAGFWKRVRRKKINIKYIATELSAAYISSAL